MCVRKKLHWLREDHIASHIAAIDTKRWCQCRQLHEPWLSLYGVLVSCQACRWPDLPAKGFATVSAPHLGEILKGRDNIECLIYLVQIQAALYFKTNYHRWRDVALERQRDEIRHGYNEPLMMLSVEQHDETEMCVCSVCVFRREGGRFGGG